MANPDTIFTQEWLQANFPQERTEAFFEALFGGAEDGAYTISLIFSGQTENVLNFAFCLRQCPGKCLACNLTYGLPQVFARHPIINVQGIITAVGAALGLDPTVLSWKLLPTIEESSAMHYVPLIITLPAA